MSFITVIYSERVTDEIRADHYDVTITEERIDGGEYMRTIVGEYADVVRYLVMEHRFADDLHWLVAEVQLEDESMDEHNVTAEAAGL